jgi:hypothetical protein
VRDERTAAAFLTASSVLLLLTLAWDHPWAHGLLALLVGIFPVGLVHLATAGRRQGARLRRALLLLALILGGSLLALLALDRAASQEMLLGLPVTLWIMLVGLTLAPLALVSWIYATTFPKRDLRPRQESHESPAAEVGPD